MNDNHDALETLLLTALVLVALTVAGLLLRFNGQMIGEAVTRAGL